MSYMVTTSAINNVTNDKNNVTNVNIVAKINNANSEHLEPFQRILTPLMEHEWRFVKSDSSNTIVMNKKFHELEEITIEYKNNHYHFTLPINNSIYSYYRKISDFYGALNNLELYVDNLF